MNLDKYINQIEQLEPLTTGYQYNAQKWQKIAGELKEMISGFEGKEVTRRVVINAYTDYYAGNASYMRAFLLTMIWGFEDTGYGAYRTNLYLSTETNTELIRQSIDHAGKNNLKISYSLLKKIKGLGVSYITKVLYFATRGAGIKDYALVFDNRVAQSLVRLFASNDIYKLVNISPSSKFENYQMYNKLIHQFANQYKVEAEAIELFLFNRSLES